MFGFRISSVAIIALLTVASPVEANDSEAATGLGGIELVQNRSISMDSEDLFISKDEVRVAYHFTNHSSEDIEALVSFPVEGSPPAKLLSPDDLEFHTTVDGKPVELSMVERAEIDGRDVTARIEELGWPIDWYDGEGGGFEFLDSLTPEQRDAYRREGLLKP